MLHIIRDRIVPTDWEEAKNLEIPKVTGLPPAKWWGADEDRCLLLGICKHGYQQYLAMRNDPEFCFYGKKYDDSQAGGLEDDDTANEKNDDGDSIQDSTETLKAPTNVIARKTYNKKDDDDSDYDDNRNEESEDEDDEYLGKQKVYIWPSKADIGMRLRRIIAAFLRERATTGRRRRYQDGTPTRGRTGNTRAGSRRRAAAGELSNRWTKKNKSDFLKTLMSFGVERDGDDYRWDRFKEIANLDKKSDDALTNHLKEVVTSCEDAVKRHATESSNNAAASALGADTETPASSPKDTNSRESSPDGNDGNEGDVISFDKARRSLKRIEQMNTIREKVLTNPGLDEILMKARKTSGLPR